MSATQTHADLQREARIEAVTLVTNFYRGAISEDEYDEIYCDAARITDGYGIAFRKAAAQTIALLEGK